MSNNIIVVNNIEGDRYLTADNRAFQWDYGTKLLLKGFGITNITKITFSLNETGIDNEAFDTVGIYNEYSDAIETYIPFKFLSNEQSHVGYYIYAFIRVVDTNEGYTVKRVKIAVELTVKPVEYQVPEEIEKFDKVIEQINNLLNETIENANESLNSAKLSKRYAVGLEGEPDTLEDNAKYYKEVCEQILSDIQDLDASFDILEDSLLEIKRQVEQSKNEVLRAETVVLQSEKEVKEKAQEVSESLSYCQIAEQAVRQMLEEIEEHKTEIDSIYTEIKKLKQSIDINITEFETKYDEIMDSETGLFVTLQNKYNTYQTNLNNKYTEYLQNLASKQTQYLSDLLLKKDEYLQSLNNKSAELLQGLETKSDKLLQEISSQEVVQKVQQLEENKADNLDLENNILSLKSGENVLDSVKIDHVLVENAEGELISINDSLKSHFDGMNVYGKSTQETTTGQQLHNINDRKGSFSNAIKVYDNDFIEVNFTNENASNRYLEINVNVSDLLEVNTSYLAVIEIKSFSNISLEVVSSNLSNSKSQFVDNFLVNSTNVIVGTLVKIVNTREDFSDCLSMLRSIITILPSSTGKAIFRISVIKDTTVTADTFKYEKFTGGLPSLNYLYPQEITNIGDKGTVNVKVLGKNLLDFRNAKGGTSAGITCTVNGDGSYSMVGTVNSPAVNVWLLGSFSLQTTVLILKAGTYYVSGVLLFGDNGNGKLSMITSSTNQKLVLENDVRVTGVRVIVRPIGESFNEVIYPSINVGEKLLSWEPYKEQILTLQTPNSLKGILVDSGGNYTDKNGQQWICDEIDLERGKYIRRIQEEIRTRENIQNVSFEQNNLVPYYRGKISILYTNNNFLNNRRRAVICNKGKSAIVSMGTVGNLFSDCFIYNNIFIFNIGIENVDKITTEEQFLDAVLGDENSLTYYYELLSYVETDLTEEEILAYKALYTNYLGTNILNDENAHMNVIYGADVKTYIDNKFKELQTSLSETQAQLI